MKKILFAVCILMFGIYHSQTYYSQDFNTAGLNGWVSTDIDGDGKQWLNANASGIYPNLGSGTLVSYSYKNGQALTPNDLITSPLINLSAVTASNAFLLYDLMTHPQNPGTPEKYSVYVTTTNNPTAITAAVPVYTESPSYAGVETKAIDLSSFIGQQVYVSFRHYDSTPFWLIGVDNVVVKTLNNNDVTLKNISLTRYGVINTDYFIKATIKNNGAQNINNVTLNWNDGTDHSSVVALPIPLAAGQEKVIIHPVAVNYSSVVDKNISVTITGINGSPDSTPADNTLSTRFISISQNSPKKVVIEEGTGTWCGWCPRGAVGMHNAENSFPNDFIGIAVHASSGQQLDPMEKTEYKAGANFSGFPSMNVDRSLLDQAVSSDFSQVITERKNLLVPVALNAATSLAGRTMTVNASAIFRTNFTNANYRFAAVVIEDGVKGTTSGYNQRNYYAGGSYGAMGGYETKPDPVPAADMVYDHVGRMLLGGYTGQAGSVPANITDGQVVSYTFTADIPTAYNIDKIKVVLLLLDATTGEIVNAAGPFAANGALGTSDIDMGTSDPTLYPNPAKDYFKIDGKEKVNIKIFDTNGRVILEKEGIEPNTSISIQNLIKGIYLVSIKEKDKEPVTKKLIIK